MLFENAMQLIGNTPMVKLNRVKEKYNLNYNIYAKLEKYNLTGSIKDKAAYYMLKKINKENITIISATSGNTGISLACLANYFNYKCIIVMNSSASVERRKIIKDYGAELILVDGGMNECVKKAQEIQKNISNSIIIDQFANMENVNAHYNLTGQEILRDLSNVDVVIAGIGSGGTITGCGKYLKEKNPKIEIIGVEPLSSPLLSKNIASVHKIQGIGANFIPNILNLKYVDKILCVSDNDAILMSKNILQLEGLSVGISSGAVLSAAISLKNNLIYKDKNIVIIMADGGERYTWN